MSEESHLLTTAEAAKFLSVSKAFLERDRWAGATIPYVRIGSRTVRYRRIDLRQYVEGRRQRHEESNPGTERLGPSLAGSTTV